jgi:retron-type reverse transcriptase
LQHQDKADKGIAAHATRFLRIESGKQWLVDMDITKFFDRVNHDILMNRIGQRIRDKRVLRLIGHYLRAGVMIEGVVVSSQEGTPQGGPLSPLLANIYLDELDKELQKRLQQIAKSSVGAWRIARNRALQTALSNAVLRRYGFLMPSDLAAPM